MSARYEVWLEGFAATGERGTAQCLGSFEGMTFREAVEEAMRVRGWDAAQYYDPSRLTFWGCRFFGKEADARRAFG